MKKTMRTLQVGDVFPTNQGSNVTVTDINGTNRISIRYNDQFGYTTIVSLHNLNNGQVKNPYHPKIFNIGYIGVGPYMSRVKDKITLEYQAWLGMLSRCYGPGTPTNNPTYIGCTVDPRWHNFQTFAEWYYTHPDYGKGYHLDKDILYHNNKVYSPETCVMAPPSINRVFVDVSHWSLNRDVTTGIWEYRGRYQVKSGDIHLGTYGTLSEAQQAYRKYRQWYVLSIAEKYRNIVDPRVYYATVALSYSML